MSWLGLGAGGLRKPRRPGGPLPPPSESSPSWSVRPCPWPGWERTSSTLTQA